MRGDLVVVKIPRGGDGAGRLGRLRPAVVSQNCAVGIVAGDDHTAALLADEAAEIDVLDALGRILQGDIAGGVAVVGQIGRGAQQAARAAPVVFCADTRDRDIAQRGCVGDHAAAADGGDKAARAGGENWQRLR